MAADFKPILNLFERFREATGGDGLAAAFLALAHVMQGQHEEPTEPLPPDPDRMMSLKEAAEYLGIGDDALRRLVNRTRRSHSGHYTEGPTLQFFQTMKHGRIQFKRVWLDEFIRQHQVVARDNRPHAGRDSKKKAASWNPLAGL